MWEDLQLVWAYKSVELYESWEEFYDLMLEWGFVNVFVIVLVMALVGSGIWNTRRKGVAWGVAIAVVWAAFHIGIGLGEAGEVRFNGTLL